MKYHPLGWLFTATILFCSTSLRAQAPTAASRPDPNDAFAAVPAAQYRSAFDAYRFMRDETVLPWRDSNDLVGRIGGWRVYAREAGSNEAPSTGQTNQSAPSVQPAPPAPSGAGKSGMDHGSHK